MKQACFFSRSALAGCFAVVFMGLAAQAQVVATPASITFDRMDQTHQINLSYNGQPLRANQIRGTGVYINENTYEYFFEIKKIEGGLTVRPTPRVEVGVMKLVISTTHGPATVEIRTPLEEDPESDISRAKAQGISVEEYRHNLGLYTRAPREQVSFSISPTYQTGQTIKIAMEKTPGRTYTWKINGEVVAQGEDANIFTHTFLQPGAKTIDSTESLAGKTVATASATTNVIAAPTISGPTVVVVR